MSDRQAGFLGILQLDAHFTRFPGDVGNPRTWSFPVRFATVAGAEPARVVVSTDTDLLAPFLAEAETLIRDGALGIATSCGYLSALQKEFTARLPVPCLTSSLLQFPLIRATLAADRQVGILTFSKQHLLPAHLTAAGIDPAVPVQGLPVDGSFQRAVLRGDRDADSFARREAEVLEAAGALLDNHPGIGAILCECTNFGPHSQQIRARFGLPVYDIVTALNWFWSALHTDQNFPRP
jgi:Asp/Glu/hydantoin racemase